MMTPPIALALRLRRSFDEVSQMTLETTQIAMLLLATSLIPQSPTVSDRVDVVELNHVYDADGRRVLSQLIFWEWNTRLARHQVVAWRLWKRGQPHPLCDPQGGEHHLLFHDNQVLRVVHARAYRESWTQYDPEIADRGRLPQNQRRGLLGIEQPSSSAHTDGTHRRR
jgi:hypothetical protein